jgi:hypothetical protein
MTQLLGKVQKETFIIIYGYLWQCISYNVNQKSELGRAQRRKKIFHSEQQVDGSLMLSAAPIREIKVVDINIQIRGYKTEQLLNLGNGKLHV